MAWEEENKLNRASIEEKSMFGSKEVKTSIVNDPFASFRNIDQIHMHYSRRKSAFLPNTEHIFVTGNVHFSNGRTEGTQNFDANNLTELFEKIRDFCLSFKE